MTIYKAPKKVNAPFKHVTDFTNLTTEQLFATQEFTTAVDAVVDSAVAPIIADLADKLDKDTGATYNVYALKAMTAAEYAAITPNPDTIYFVI
jgi:hypothetical protein